MENITFCDLSMEDLRHVDPNVIKMFHLAQLIIEYQLHSQEFLISQRDRADADTNSANSKISELTTQNTLLTTQLSESKKELKALKKTLNIYQLMAKLPTGGGGMPMAPALLNQYYASFSTRFNSWIEM